MQLLSSVSSKIQKLLSSYAYVGYLDSLAIYGIT